MGGVGLTLVKVSWLGGACACVLVGGTECLLSEVQ